MGRLVLRVLVVLSLLFAGLRIWMRSNAPTAAGGGSGNVTAIASDDPAMLAAIAKARATVDRFTAALAHPLAGQKHFAVKWPVTQGDAVEHFWVEDVTFDGAKFRGVIQDEPEMVTSVRAGQAVTVPLVEITDWMYIDGGSIVGGYTARVIRDKLPAEERRKFDQRVHFKSDS
ncbi:MAG: DUF2314 domain-containing protein [Phycisphaerales bacterium]